MKEVQKVTEKEINWAIL